MNEPGDLGAMTGGGEATPREDRDEAHTRLVAAARAEFLNAGFAGANVASIATRAGISKKTVYKYATSKEGLLFEVLSEAFTQLLSPTFGAGCAEMTRAEIARCLVEFCVLSTSDDGVTTHRLAIGEARHFPRMAQAYKLALEEFVLTPLSRWIQRQIDLGYLRVDDPRLAADMLACMTVSPYMRDLSLGVEQTPSRQDVERVVNTALNLFYVGCAIRPMP